jgi:hypothetical protein
LTATIEEQEALDLMEKSTFYKENEKTWYTSLLFKEGPINLSHNKEGAMAVLRKVEEKTTKDGKITDVNLAYNAMIDGNFAEKVPQNETEKLDNVHYLQCHPVYREGSESTKTRIVMNASAKTRKNVKFLVLDVHEYVWNFWTFGSILDCTQILRNVYGMERKCCQIFYAKRSPDEIFIVFIY